LFEILSIAMILSLPPSCFESAAMARSLLATLFILASLLEVAADDSLQVFERRILPILNSKKPSSCSECHLSGVDLKDYIRPNQAETFAALKAAGLINVEAPEKSKLLEFIARAPKQPGLIKPEVRQAELDAFQAWITAAVADPKLLAAKTDKSIGPKIPDEVIRHSRQDRVLQSFEENIWLEAGRCAGCHSPDLNAEQVKKHGEQMSWMVPGDAEATLRTILENDLIDLQAPEKSLLIAKPTLQVKHGGGQKMVIGDRSYQQFMAFLTDYAASAQGKYQSVEELPTPSESIMAATDAWLKITDIPETYGTLLLRAEAYPADGEGWAKTPLVVGDRNIAGDRHLWQQHMSLSLQRGSEMAHQMAKASKNDRKIPGGKYLLKIWVATAEDFASGQVAQKGRAFETTFTTQWPGGYGNMTVVKFPTPPAP
jgi:hypothetical protein